MSTEILDSIFGFIMSYELLLTLTSQSSYFGLMEIFLLMFCFSMVKVIERISD